MKLTKNTGVFFIILVTCSFVLMNYGKDNNKAVAREVKTIGQEKAADSNIAKAFAYRKLREEVSSLQLEVQKRGLNIIGHMKGDAAWDEYYPFLKKLMASSELVNTGKFKVYADDKFELDKDGDIRIDTNTSIKKILVYLTTVISELEQEQQSDLSYKEKITQLEARLRKKGLNINNFKLSEGTYIAFLQKFIDYPLPDTLNLEMLKLIDIYADKQFRVWKDDLHIDYRAGMEKIISFLK